jgi:hypothetical protein
MTDTAGNFVIALPSACGLTAGTAVATQGAAVFNHRFLSFGGCNRRSLNLSALGLLCNQKRVSTSCISSVWSSPVELTRGKGDKLFFAQRRYRQ